MVKKVRYYVEFQIERINRPTPLVIYKANM